MLTGKGSTLRRRTPVMRTKKTSANSRRSSFNVQHHAEMVRQDRTIREAQCPAFDHGAIIHSARDRLRGKLSYSNIGFALAPATFTLNELRDVYAAALGYDVSATNLKRVLLRRGALSPTGGRRDSGRAGGRPAEEFAFSEQALEITDPFAALRPPGPQIP